MRHARSAAARDQRKRRSPKLLKPSGVFQVMLLTQFQIQAVSVGRELCRGARPRCQQRTCHPLSLSATRPRAARPRMRSHPVPALGTPRHAGQEHGTAPGLTADVRCRHWDVGKINPKAFLTPAPKTVSQPAEQPSHISSFPVL